MAYKLLLESGMFTAHSSLAEESHMLKPGISKASMNRAPTGRNSGYFEHHCNLSQPLSNFLKNLWLKDIESSDSFFAGLN